MIYDYHTDGVDLRKGLSERYWLPSEKWFVICHESYRPFWVLTLIQIVARKRPRSFEIAQIGEFDPVAFILSENINRGT